jgi:hypothetical protein
MSGGLKQPWSSQLSEISSVESVGRAGLRITLRRKESHEFEIAKSLWSPRFSSSNSSVRDEAIQVIRATAGDEPSSRLASQAPAGIPSRALGELAECLSKAIGVL